MDRFDDIWKNRFNEGEDLPEDFGTPDDSVWKEIERNIEAKPKRKGWLWWLVGMGLFIILFAVLSSKAFNKSDSYLSYQQSSQSQLMSALSDDFGKKKKEGKVNIQDNIHPSEKKNPTVLNNSKTKKERPSQEADKQFVINEVLVKEFVQTPNVLANEMVLSEKVEEAINVEKLIENNISQPINPQIDVLASLQDDLLLLESSSIELPNLSAAKIIQPIQSNSKFSVAPVAGGVYWRHRISDQYTSDLSAFEFNYSDEIGWTSGLKLGLSLGKYFEINTGLQYAQIEVASGHNSEIGYDPNLEAGNKSNSYDLTLATPYGLTEASFVLNRSSDVGSDEVPLKVDFFSGHTVTNFSAPIEVRFSPYGKKRTWQPFVGIGAGFNYISKIQNRINNIDTHHSAITFDRNAQSFSNSEIKKTFYDLRGSAGLGYHFSNKNQLNFNYSFARGLNAVFELQEYRTAIDQHYFTVELKRSF